MKRIRIEPPKGLAPSRRPFFARASGRSFDVRAQGDRAEISIYEEIGSWGVTASAFRRQLDAIKGGTIVLRLNSPGGDVFDGIAMHNDLLDHPARIEVEVIGLAASAASIIAMAGDTVTVRDNAFLMIHNAWTIAVGDRHQMDEVAGVLERIDAALARTYAARTGLDPVEIEAMMDAETWLDGASAVDRGFADATAAAAEPQARFDLSVFRNVPAGLSAACDERPTPKTRRDLERVLTQDAGLSRSQARAAMAALTTGNTTMQDAGSDALAAALEGLRSVIQ